MLVQVLFFVLVLNQSSAQLSCESEVRFGLCYLSGQKISATDAFQISGLNGADVSFLIIANIEMPTMPSTIFTNYPNITFLSLAENGILQLSLRNFANAVKLTKLYVAFGFITRIASATFRSCTSLENLQVTSQKVSVLEAGAFQGLPNLNSLMLKNNSIEVLPSSIFDTLPLLQVLDCGDNKIKTLSSSLFLKNPRLFFVDFSKNQLTEIPSDLFSSNTLLNSIYFNNNLLTSARTYGATYTDLSYNGLRKLQINPGTETLHIHDNSVDTIECPDLDLSSFSRVFADNNALTNFNCIRDMINLTELCVSNNKFPRPAQDVFMKMKMLRSLEMFNQTKFLKTTVKSFSPLKALTILRVDRLINFQNIRQILPSLYQVGLTTKTWNCSYQTRITKVLKQQKISFSYNVLKERSVCNIKLT